jgi:hypothetical protein
MFYITKYLCFICVQPPSWRTAPVRGPLLLVHHWSPYIAPILARYFCCGDKRILEAEREREMGSIDEE